MWLFLALVTYYVFLCKTELDRKLKKTEILCEVKIKNVRGRIGNI